MAEDISMGDRFLCISSIANIAPAKGALNAAASPALAPQVIRYFSSMRSRPSKRLVPCAKEAPICIEGAPLPKDKPLPMANTVVKILPINKVGQLALIRPQRIPFTCGIPLPPNNGSLRVIQPKSRPINIRAKNQKGIVQVSPLCIKEYSLLRRYSDFISNSR